MIGSDNETGGKPLEPRRERNMQAAVAREQKSLETPAKRRMLFERFWEDVAPLNNFSPEAARALLARENETLGSAPSDGFATDPRSAVQAALSERAAGRKISF